jgi:hypothetical protein
MKKYNCRYEDFYLNVSEDLSELREAVDYVWRRAKKEIGLRATQEYSAKYSIVKNLERDACGMGIPNREPFGFWTTNVLSNIIKLTSTVYSDFTKDFMDIHNGAVIHELCHASGYEHKDSHYRDGGFFLQLAKSV